jgi:hypothetical protein
LDETDSYMNRINDFSQATPCLSTQFHSFQDGLKWRVRSEQMHLFKLYKASREENTNKSDFS